MNVFRRRLGRFVLLTLLLPVGAVAQKPELIVQTGHVKSVEAIAFSPDGRALASASLFANTVKLWEVATGRELRTLRGHTEGVNTVAFSPDGKLVASGSNDKTIRLWEVESGRQVRTLQAQPFRVTSVAFSPDGTVLAGGGYNNQGKDQHQMIKLWAVSTGSEIRTLAAHALQCNVVAFSPDGRTLASGSDDQTIKLWDVASGREVRTLKGHADKINSVVFSPDGRTLASGSGNFIESRDSTVRLWAVATGKELRTLGKFSSQITSVVFSPDGQTLAAVGGMDEQVRRWNVPGGMELASLVERDTGGASSSLSAVAFSPDNRTLAASNQEQEVVLWDLRTGRDLRALRGHASPVSAVAYRRDGKAFASLGLDAKIKYWSIAAGRECRTLADGNAFALSPDGKGVAVAENGGVKLFDPQTGAERQTVFVEGGVPLALAFSPDGSQLAGAGFDNNVALWDAGTGQKLRTLVAPTIQRVFSVVFSPDGKVLAGAGNTPDRTKNQMIVLWDSATGRVIRVLSGHAFAVHAIAFSPDGRLLASGGLDNAVKLWDVVTGREVRTLAGHADWVEAVAFSPDGRTLASGGLDHTVRLWDVPTGAARFVLSGHAEAVESVAFNPDGRTLLSGGDDAQIKLWDVTSGTEAASLIAFDQTDWLVATPAGFFDGTPAAWGQILWRFSPRLYDVTPVEIFFNEFYYPGLLADIFNGKRPQAAQDILQKDRRQPDIALVQSTSGTETTAARNVTIKVLVTEKAPDSTRNTGSGAQDVRLFRNGSLVRVWHGDVLKGQSSATLEAAIPIVAGENTLTAYTFNRDNIKSADATLFVTGADSLSRKGTAYVLAVGINEYANAQYNLKYAVADAQAFSAEVKRQQARLERFDKVEVTTLVDQQATKQAILNKLAELTSTVQPEDELIVYFAGHGTAHLNQFYLIPHDLGHAGSRTELDQAALAVILAHSISDRELEQAFERLDAGQILFVIDACNSGQALEAEERRRGPMNSKGLAQLAYEKGMYILTAAQSFQAAQEATQLGHGLLTYALIEEGLKQAVADDEPKDGTVLAREWLDYAATRVPLMQLDKMKAARGLGLNLSFSEEERGLDVEKRIGQRPRVFYRREVEVRPLVIAKPDQP
jgi:WD40 repeat protein